MLILMFFCEILTSWRVSRRRLLSDTHVVGCIGASSISQVLLHHRQLVLHGGRQEQLIVHSLRLNNQKQACQLEGKGRCSWVSYKVKGHSHRGFALG